MAASWGAEYAAPMELGISFRGGFYNYAAPLALECIPNAVRTHKHLTNSRLRVCGRGAGFRGRRSGFCGSGSGQRGRRVDFAGAAQTWRERGRISWAVRRIFRERAGMLRERPRILRERRRQRRQAAVQPSSQASLPVWLWLRPGRFWVFLSPR